MRSSQWWVKARDLSRVTSYCYPLLISSPITLVASSPSSCQRSHTRNLKSVVELELLLILSRSVVNSCLLLFLSRSIVEAFYDLLKSVVAWLLLQVLTNCCGHSVQRWLSTIRNCRYDVITPRSGVNDVVGANPSVQCVNSNVL